MTTTLITGIAGGLAQRVAERLLDAGDRVVGVDYRPTARLPAALEGRVIVERANYNKTAIEDVFRRHRPDRVLHLGRVGNLKESPGKRFDLNVVGSQKIMNLCELHGVCRLVVLSTFHIYGAHPANHIPIAEDEPLRAGVEHPQLADAIQLDNMATTWVWKHESARVCVLRPTNVIGPHLRNTMSEILRLRRIPRLFGFDPMMQFVHEDDLARAIVLVADSDVRGIFNVAGKGAIPWSTAIECAGAAQLLLPTPAVKLYAALMSSIPSYLIDFLKYPCVITDDALRAALGYAPRVSIAESIASTVAPA
jgi:UDP-glucose 4-epimerase